MATYTNGPYSPAVYAQQTPGAAARSTPSAFNLASNSYNDPLPQTLGASTTNTGGGGGAAPISGNPGTQIPQPQQPNIDYDAIIAPGLAALDQAVQAAQSGYAANTGMIGANQQENASILDQNLASQQQLLGQSRTGAQNTAQNAIQQAKQGYNEISQGIQSRFGGSTGTGAFSTELAGRQTTTNIAGLQQNLMSALSQLDQTGAQLLQTHDKNMLDLKKSAEAATLQAKAELDRNIATIGIQRGVLQSQKAQMTADAVSQYQQSVNQVNLLNAQFAQQLEANKQIAQQNIASAQASAKAQVDALTKAAQSTLQPIAQSSPLSFQQPTTTASSAGQWNMPTPQQKLPGQY